QLAAFVTVPASVGGLPAKVTPLRPGRLAWSPRLPPPDSAIPLPPFALVVVWVIRLPTVPAPLTSMPLATLPLTLLVLIVLFCAPPCRLIPARVVASEVTPSAARPILLF